MKVKIKNYYWTELDFISAVGIVVFLCWMGFKIVDQSGITLASVAGSIWGMGILGFFFFYQFPLFGNSVKGQELLDQQKESYTQEEARVIIADRRRKPISSETLRKFFLFFFISGGLALVGVFINT